MEVKCPQCDSRFNLPDNVAKPGARLRCTVCKTVFSLPGDAREAPSPARPGAPSGQAPPDRLPDMGRGRKSVSGRVLGLFFTIVLLGAIGCGGYYYWFHIREPEQSGLEDASRNVAMLTMRNVRQYNVLNEKAGKVFVIEGKVVNEFPTPRDFIQLEGAIYDREKRPIAIKKQLAGTQLSLFQLQVLSEKEMESFLNNKIEILANNTNVPTGGEVPFMILFYDPPETVSEFGVKIIDAKVPDGVRDHGV